jgi:hypothetical protein
MLSFFLKKESDDIWEASIFTDIMFLDISHRFVFI